MQWIATYSDHKFEVDYPHQDETTTFEVKFFAIWRFMAWSKARKREFSATASESWRSIRLIRLEKCQ